MAGTAHTLGSWEGGTGNGWKRQKEMRKRSVCMRDYHSEIHKGSEERQGNAAEGRK